MVIIVTMESVNIATLKAKISHYLRLVRGGTVVRVLDRQTPIARIVPYEGEDALPSRRPRRQLAEVELPRRADRGLDSLGALIEERQGDR